MDRSVMTEQWLSIDKWRNIRNFDSASRRSGPSSIGSHFGPELLPGQRGNRDLTHRIAVAPTGPSAIGVPSSGDVALTKAQMACSQPFLASTNWKSEVCRRLRARVRRKV
jgi:hypothetical protein